MKQYFISLIIPVILIMCGCSAGGNGPIIPNLDSTNLGLSESQTADSGSSRVLWGLYEVRIDKLGGTVDAIPLRGAMFNSNVAHFLSPPHSPMHLMTIQLLPGSDLLAGFLDMEIGLAHPFPGMHKYRGFDVRGIFMADGTHVSDHDAAIRYGTADMNEAYMLNADGYTRWWNATEFTDPFPLFSFKPGAMGNDPDPSATLNPYKYFADDLPYEGDVGDLPPDTRGVFSPIGTAHKRNYKIQFPMNGSPHYKFNYAIDASWEPPDPAYEPEYPIESFPPGAQCQEAYHVLLDTSGTTAWYEDSDSGGAVHISLEVFDWQAPMNPSGATAEIDAIWVESSVLDSPVDIFPLATVSPGTQSTSSVFDVELADSYLSLTTAGTFELLGSIESSNPTTYQPQLDGGENFIYPDGPLAAYFMGTVEIGSATLDLTITKPNGGEEWDVGSSQEILWTGGMGIDYVTLQYSKDDFVSDISTIATDIINNGSFTWDPVPDDPSDTVIIRVCDADNFADYDDSDDYFTISAPLEILQPNGGEQWIIGTSQNIDWTGGTGIDTVTLEYSKDDFVGDVNTIVADTPNDGSINWNPIPDDPSDTVKVRVFDSADPDNYDDSDDYFTIIDQCIFTDSPTYDHYDTTDVVWSTGFDFMQVDSTRVVSCRPSSDGAEEYYPWLAVYNDSDYSAPLDTFQVPGWAYPNRPWCFQVDSTDRVFFFMDNEYPIDYGTRFDTFYHIQWDGSEFVETSLTSIDITSYLDPGELGGKIWLDSNDDLYIITTQGKVLKLYEATDYTTGDELFDLIDDPEYQQGMEFDFFLAEEINAFFIYLGYSSRTRSIYRVSYDGTIQASDTNIWQGIHGASGYVSGGIGSDGDCRLIAVDGHIFNGISILRYDYNLDQKASEYCGYIGYMVLPGNTAYFEDDGTIRFNTDAWTQVQLTTKLLFFDTPSDW